MNVERAVCGTGAGTRLALIDNDGGDLELLYGTEPQKLAKARGTFIVFPSFMLHRVTPVTRGTRWSLVAWIAGARWR